MSHDEDNILEEIDDAIDTLEAVRRDLIQRGDNYSEHTHYLSQRVYRRLDELREQVRRDRIVRRRGIL